MLRFLIPHAGNGNAVRDLFSLRVKGGTCSSYWQGSSQGSSPGGAAALAC